MKVVHFITNGAASNFLLDLATHHDRTRWDLVVGSLGPPGALQLALGRLGVEAFSLGCTRRAHYPAAAARLARLLAARRVDVLHTHLIDASFVGLAAARLARTPARLMTRHYSDAVERTGSRRGRAVDRLLSRHLATHVVAPSLAVERFLRLNQRVPAARVSLIPYGFDWERIRPSGAPEAALRREFRCGDGPVLCTVGRLDPYKGHDVLIRSLAQSGLPPTARLLIVGEGDQRARLSQLAGECGVGQQVVFTGYRTDAYDVMAASDVVVHPSLSEAQNQVIIEALALGRPVVATSVGAAGDVILPGRTGWLVPPGDVPALAGAVREAVRDPADALARAAAGREIVRSLYPIDGMIRSYDELYGRLLNGRGAGGAR